MKGLQQALARIREAVRRDKSEKLTSLYHLVYNIEHLREAYFSLKRRAAPGVDGETWQAYGQDLEAHLQDLAGRLARGGYPALPVRRKNIPKADGRQRPLGIPALEDKIVQKVVAEILSVIWEEEFLGFTHISGKTRAGRFTVRRQTMRKRVRAKLQALKGELRRRMHRPIPEQGQWLRTLLQGHFQYYGVPMNARALGGFRQQVMWLWKHALGRRSQRGRITWERMRRLACKWLPYPHIYHPWPSQRLVVRT